LKRYDVAIVGGGIVGLATAMALTAEDDVSLAVVEAEPEIARHQTGHNSGVIHSGLYYAPGSLKAHTCVAGRDALYRFCAEEEIPAERRGKLVIAAEEEELPRLDELERRGRANGLEGLERLGPREIAELEPAARGIAGLLVTQTGLVDYRRVAAAYARRIAENGGEVLTCTRVERVAHLQGEIRLGTAAGKIVAGEISCRLLVGCAGLQSDRLARLCGLEPRVRIVPFRGDYYELRPERRDLVHRPIYPVPDPRFPFLGVHLTPLVDGRLEAGPNAVLALARGGYGRFDVSIRDTLSSLGYPGFWRLAARYWRIGLAEVRRSFSRHAFAEALRRLVPAIEDGDLLPAGCGIRAQALESSGKLVDDFRWVEDERTLHVLNAPSPAATASIEIGRRIAERVRAKLATA